VPRFPHTVLAYACLPLWLLKRGLLGFHRVRVRRSTVHRWFDEVDPSLVVGGAIFAGDAEALRAAGVGSVLSLCAEYLDPDEECARLGIVTHRIACHDDFAPTRVMLDEALRWIDARVALGHKVYVHCAAGRGRSVTVAIAWLARTRGLKIDEALARVRSVRRAAQPTPWQMRAARRYVGEIA
jgi:atypical dual specificity phosphatase